MKSYRAGIRMSLKRIFTFWRMRNRKYSSYCIFLWIFSTRLSVTYNTFTLIYIVEKLLHDPEEVYQKVTFCGTVLSEQ
jgi:hypothetical protein